MLSQESATDTQGPLHHFPVAPSPDSLCYTVVSALPVFRSFPQNGFLEVKTPDVALQLLRHTVTAVSEKLMVIYSFT